MHIRRPHKLPAGAAKFARKHSHNIVLPGTRKATTRTEIAETDAGMLAKKFDLGAQAAHAFGVYEVALKRRHFFHKRAIVKLVYDGENKCLPVDRLGPMT